MKADVTEQRVRTHATAKTLARHVEAAQRRPSADLRELAPLRSMHTVESSWAWKEWSPSWAHEEPPGRPDLGDDGGHFLKKNSNFQDFHRHNHWGHW